MPLYRMYTNHTSNLYKIAEYNGGNSYRTSLSMCERRNYLDPSLCNVSCNQVIVLLSDEFCMRYCSFSSVHSWKSRVCHTAVTGRRRVGHAGCESTDSSLRGRQKSPRRLC